MSHDLEITPAGASMAYNTQDGTPWHRLGTPLEGLQTMKVMLETARADYEVKKAPATMEDPDNPGTLIQVDNKFVTWRRTPTVITPTGVSGGDVQALGVVGNQYHIIQNEEALKFALAIAGVAEGEAVVDTAGVLNDGKAFFAYVRLPATTVMDEDYSNGLGVVTGHDGTRSLQVVRSKVRIVCRNTVEAALDSPRRITIRHSGRASDSEMLMAEARSLLGIRQDEEEAFAAIAHRLAGTAYTKDQLVTLADKLWDVTNPGTLTPRQETNRQKRLDTLTGLWGNDRNAGTVGGNGWAAFNTIAEYLDHHSRGDDDARAVKTILQDGTHNRKAEAAARILAAV